MNLDEPALVRSASARGFAALGRRASLQREGRRFRKRADIAGLAGREVLDRLM